MPKMVKQNDNGAMPGCPDNKLPEPAGMDEAVQRAVAEANAMAAGMNKYTKPAPWRKG